MPRPPNILLLMSDQHAPQFSGVDGHPIVRTPHLDALASQGVVFERAYCPSPLCAPSRASFMTGLQVHRTGVWDNGASIVETQPTWAHLLRAEGYDVLMCGEMYMIGMDNLHGFQEDLTGDRRRHPIQGGPWRAESPRAAPPPADVVGAGPGRSQRTDWDDAAEEAALQFLKTAPGRARPWVLSVGFSLPHSPLIAPPEWFEQYSADAVDLPAWPARADDHPAHRRLRTGQGAAGLSEAQVRRARAAYYALVSFIDAKVGHILGALERSGLAGETLVIYTSDHGELLGEHGLWWKGSFFEHSIRVPLIIRWPGHALAGVRTPAICSLVDLTATLLDAAGATSPHALDGDSLAPLLRDPAAPWKDEAFGEYYGPSVGRASRMLRAGRWKLNVYHGEPSELYDLAADPGECCNLAGRSDLAAVERALLRRLTQDWDPAAIDASVRLSQRQRAVIATAQMGAER